MQVEAHDVEPERRRCPACGDEYGAHGSEDSEQLEIEVRAYRRVIKRRRYRRSCQCAAAPALLTAAAPPRLIPKGILGISVWVTVLIDKYLLYRPTYRLLADLRAHGLDLAQGTVTDGMRRLAPLFAPLREALIARSRTGQHWHADETRWQVFEADSEDACQRWCLWVFWSAEVVVFTLDPTRSARVPKQHFATVTGGVVSVDRYSAYKRLAKDTALVLSFCWVHMRRDFITIANERDDQEEWAEQWLADIAALYHLNDERLQVRAEPTQYAAADAALRAGVQAMQERRECELAQQPKLPEACAKWDSSIHEVYGQKKEGADFAYDNTWSYSALYGTLAETGDVLYLGLREGYRHTSYGTKEVLPGTIERVSKHFRQVRMRADSGYYSQALVKICEQRGVEFFIVAKQHRNLMNAVREIPESHWKSFADRDLQADDRRRRRRRRANLKRKIAIRRKPNSRFKGAPEIAGMMFKPKSWNKARRYVIKRTPIVDKDDQQLYLDDGLRRYVYWIVVNNSKRSNEQVLRIAQGRGNQENLIKDFKYGLGLAHIPTGSLAANQAYFMIAALAWNLKTWMLNLLHLGDGAVMRFQRFRYQWIWQAGTVAKSGRNTVVLKLPAGEYFQRFGVALARLATL